MMKFAFLFLSILILISCKGKSNENQPEKLVKESNYFRSFGKKITIDEANNVASLVSSYKSLSVKDTLQCKVIAKVNDVCQVKGCWMTLGLGNGDEMMVKFKDYGFFVPKDISGQEVIVNGKAYIAEVSVEEQKHCAIDAKKSEDEISKITQPKRTYLFEADGVLLK